MIAVVLCAGYGTRLGKLTRSCPKPMLPVCGKPLLEHIIVELKKNEIKEIAVNLHYLHEQIRDYFGDGSRFGVRIHYFHEQELLGTAGALRQMHSLLTAGDEFFVIYGDVLTNQNLKDLLRIHRRKKSFATLLLHRREKPQSIVKLSRSGQIQSFTERPNNVPQVNDKELWLVNSAVQVLGQEALSYIIEKQASDLPRDVYEPLAQKEKLYGVLLTGERVAVDSSVRLAEAEELVKKGFFG